MAVMECQECGGDVSTEAKFCPHCGIEDPLGERARKKERRKERLAEAAGAVSGVGCMGLGCAAQSVFLVLELLFGLFVLGLILRGCTAVFG